MMLNSDTMELDCLTTLRPSQPALWGRGGPRQRAGPGGRAARPRAWNLESRAGKTCST